MRYVQETCVCGRVIEVTKYHDWNHGRRNSCRGPRRRKTPESMQQVNERNAEKKLRRKLNAGCLPGDYHITLTYAGGTPPSPEEAMRRFKNYIKRLARLYKKHGFELRWLAVTEYKNKRIHHHLILNQGPDLLAIVNKWDHGRPKVTLLDETGQYAALAHYLIKETRKTFRDKETVQKKRWSCSKNWPEPQITKKVIKRERWAREPRPRKGYVLEKDKTVEGFTDDGYPYQFYSMVKIHGKIYRE